MDRTPRPTGVRLTAAIADRVRTRRDAEHLAALRYNALDMVVRAGGVPDPRREQVDPRARGHRRDAGAAGLRGILAFTLPEALWLAETHDDVVLGLPDAPIARRSRALAADEHAASRVTLMVDDIAQLDLVDAVAAPRRAVPRSASRSTPTRRGALPALGHIGVRRSPVHAPAEVANLARAHRRPPRLPAGRPHDVRGPDRRSGRRHRLGRRGHPLDAAPLRRRAARRAAPRSSPRVARHRAARVRQRRRDRIARATASDQAVTEVTAGSGLLAGHLFDGYRASTRRRPRRSRSRSSASPRPTSRPCSAAAGSPPGPPLAVAPAAARCGRRADTLAARGRGRGADPAAGRGGRGLRVGDRVWFRHAKSGELAERVDASTSSTATGVVGETPTYRGEGKAFL